jgi:hypothetical protein
MNTHAPPKETGALLHAPKNEPLVAYRLPRFLQAVGNRRGSQRRCVSCNCCITNRKLGGYDGRSALTGPLWCLRCADCPQQLLLALGGTA